MSGYVGLKTPPPFFENWDDVHCGECCLRSILDHFEPDNKLSWDDIDMMAGKVPGKATWPQKMAVEMLNRGYTLKFIELFDDEEMLREGIENYLIKSQGKEAAAWSVQNSPDLSTIEKHCRNLLNHPKKDFEKKLPSLKDIRQFLQQGYLIISMINAKILDGKDGYAGHFVLIYAIDDEHIYFHDPGLEPYPKRKEKNDFFIKAATSPTFENWSIAGYKYSS